MPGKPVRGQLDIGWNAGADPVAGQLEWFDGATYVPERAADPGNDRERLSAQLALVRSAMADREWHSLAELAELAHCTTQSASARVRDLRKRRFGGHTIERQYVSRGLFLYRLVA